jgi:hypothetical protein
MKKLPKSVEEAVTNGDLVGLKYLIELCNARDDVITNRNTYLIIAAQMGHLRIVEHLRFKYVNNKTIDSEYIDIALYYAASNGHLEIVKFLIEKCDAEKYGHHYNEMLIGSAECGHLEVVEFLLKCASKFTDVTMNSAIYSAMHNSHVNVVRCLLKHDINIGDYNKDILYQGIKTGDLDIVKLLDKTYKTDIHEVQRIISQRYNHSTVEIVDYLCEKYADKLTPYNELV